MEVLGECRGTRTTGRGKLAWKGATAVRSLFQMAAISMVLCAGCSSESSPLAGDGDSDAGGRLDANDVNSSGGTGMQSTGGWAPVSSGGAQSTGGLATRAGLDVRIDVREISSGAREHCVELSASSSGGTAPYAYKWGGQGFVGPGPHELCVAIDTQVRVEASDAGASGEFGAAPRSGTAQVVVAGVAEVPAVVHRPPGTRLRDTPPGMAPRFDPDAVYFVGDSNALPSPENGYASPPWVIAPVTDPEDVVYGIGLFAGAYVRRSDGVLIHNDYVPYEFVRDAIPASAEGAPDITDNDVQFDVDLPCPRSEFEGRDSRLSWNGEMYHTCNQPYEEAAGIDVSDGRRGWYAADGTLAWVGRGLWRIGPGNVAVRAANDGWGLVLAHFDVNNTPIAPIPLDYEPGYFAKTIRTRQDRFVIASGRDGTVERDWLEIDFAGNVLGQGEFAPLPPGVRFSDDNRWRDGGDAAMDGNGCLYEFGFDGPDDDSLIIVRQPRAGEGESAVIYRARDFLDSPSALRVRHWWGEAELITGQ